MAQAASRTAHAQVLPVSSVRAIAVCVRAKARDVVAAPTCDRRTMLASTAAACMISMTPSAASAAPQPMATLAAQGFGRYIKRKQLDPLETYVPLVLEAQAQLAASGGLMGSNKEAARTLLRTGAFSGLRDNIRAVGEFAEQAPGATKESASNLVSTFFIELSDYDYALFQGIKSEEDFNKEKATAKFTGALAALDALLATVPADVMARAREVYGAAAAKASAPPGSVEAAGGGAGAGAEDAEDRALRALLPKK
ncbi:hypothetical protein FOA52_011300 [Chlamydomonas sp. UWO 241]|nr:hypothetical protein FOA52_011300 [Chlamydomonas sp. UWO 241]